jgi:hypothetical protein
MTAQWKRVRNTLTLLGLVAVAQPAATAEATSGYAAQKPGASASELRPEMTAYDPNMLSIHFYQNPEIPVAPPEETPESGSVFADMQQQLPETSPSEEQQPAAAQPAAPAPPEPIATPEPGTLALLGLGLSALVAWRRKTHNKLRSQAKERPRGQEYRP